MTTMLYVGTHGPEDPTRATFPFHFANGALDAGFQAKVLLVGDAAFLMRSSIAKEVHGMAVPALAELMRKVVDRGATIDV